MWESRIRDRRRISALYGAFAYGLVVLTCFASFLMGHPYYYTSEAMVPVVFTLGAVYLGIGILGGDYDQQRSGSRAAAYYLIQTAVVTALLWLSPVRGFIAILVLPLVSQAIFDLRARYAGLLAVYMFAQCVALIGVAWGGSAALQSASDYATGFVFTIVFTMITRRALQARQREEQLRKQVEAANQQLREQAAAMETLATTRERNRLAREIHDGVGHYLTVAKTQLDAAAALLPDQPERAHAAICQASRMTGEALDDVRRSVGALRADAVLAPLPERLQALIAESGLPGALRIEGCARPLSPSLDHALFRSVQEALTNVRKHAGDARAEVVLDFREPGRVDLTVQDDGGGATGGTSTGFGLRGLSERVELLGGRLTCGSRSTGGFAVHVEVPA